MLKRTNSSDQQLSQNLGNGQAVGLLQSRRASIQHTRCPGLVRALRPRSSTTEEVPVTVRTSMPEATEVAVGYADLAGGSRGEHVHIRARPHSNVGKTRPANPEWSRANLSV